jgi:hypothetical protein
MAEVKYTVVGEARFEQLERELARAEQNLDTLQQKARRAQGAAADAAATGDLSERMAGRTFLERIRPGDVSADDAARRARMSDRERSRDMFRALHAMADARDAGADPRPASGSAAALGLMTNEQLALKNQRLLANAVPNPPAPGADSPLSARPPSVAELAGRAAMEAGGWEALAEQQRAKRVADQVAADALKAQASKPSDFVQPQGKYGPHRFGERIGDERRAFEARQRERESQPLQRVPPAAPPPPPPPPVPPRPPGGSGGPPVPPVPPGTAQALGGVASALSLVNLAAIPATIAVYAYAEGMRKQTEEAVAANLKADLVERDLNVSTGEEGPPDQESYKRVMGLAYKYAVPTDYAADVVKSAVKSGMSREDALGAGGESYLRVATAMNATQPGKDRLPPRELATSIQSMLRAEGRPIAPKEVERIGMFLRSAYEGELTLPDVPFIAKELPGILQSGGTTEETIAAVAALRDVGKSASSSATDLRNVVKRTRTARSSRAKVDALRRIGIAPEQVDLVGEDLSAVLDVYAAAKKKADPVEFDAALLKIFEDRGAPALQALIAPEIRNRTRNYLKLMRDPKSLDKYNELGTSGAAANAQRDKISMEASALGDKPLMGYDQLVEKANVMERERGVPGGIRDLNTWLLKSLGYFLGPSLAESVAGFSPDVYKRLENDTKGAKEQIPKDPDSDPIVWLKEIAKNTKKKDEPPVEKGKAKSKPGADEE